MGGAMRSSEGGVSLIEVLLASFLLTVALLSVAMTMAQGIAAIGIGQQQLIAKQKAQEALESVIMARNTQDIGFTQIANVADSGVFVAGYTNIVGMGVDGIPNTGDDTSTIESLTFSGPDGNLGNSDDVTVSLSGYQRKITVSTITLPSSATVDPDIRRVDVDVQYTVRGVAKTVRVSTLISRFS